MMTSIDYEVEISSLLTVQDLWFGIEVGFSLLFYMRLVIQGIHARWGYNIGLGIVLLVFGLFKDLV